MICLRLATTVILLSLFVLPLRSQPLQVDYLGIENGLSNNAVNTIFQDHNGFMWFGTYDGLSRYDGYSFKVFRNIISDSSSITSNNINTIAEDAHFNLWVGEQKSINILQALTNRFTHPAYLMLTGETQSALNDNITMLCPVPGNKMLAGTQHNGLFQFDENGNPGKQVSLPRNNNSATDYYVVDIKYAPSSRTTYVFVQNEGLFVYDVNNKRLQLISNAIQQANCIQINEDGTLWLGTNNGLYRFTANGSFSENLFLKRTNVVNISEDKNGTLWIASDGAGVWVLQAGKQLPLPLSAFVQSETSLVNSNAVYAVYEDKDGRKWIGTLRGGVNVIQPGTNSFANVIYKSNNALNTIDNFILSFCEEGNGNLWIGTDGGGLRYWNRSANEYRVYKHNESNSTSISSNFITSIIQGANDDLWISTWFGGINRFHKNTQTFEHYTCFNPQTQTQNQNVWYLFKDSRSRLWALAVRGGGLYRFNNKTNSFDCFDSRLPDLQCIAEDREGNLWCGDYSSLICIDTVAKKHAVYNIGYPVRCIYEDKKKDFWVGTQEGGLLRFNKKNGSFGRLTTTDGLPHNTILRMLEDASGNIWLSTYYGISRFNPLTVSFRNFSQSDGLQSNQFSFNGAIVLQTGEFAFGGIKGFTIFHPDGVVVNSSLPKLFLNSFKINNSPVEENPDFINTGALGVTHITIPYDQASLSLEFLGLDYSNAENLGYAYYLEGWDKDWNYSARNRTANYSRLHEGSYTFRVKVNAAGGAWGKPETLLRVTVLPPPYRTWWAYGLYLLFGAGLVYSYIRYKNRQTKLTYEVQLAHLETQKEKELNEKKIDFFTNISHEFRTPLSLIINPVKEIIAKSNTPSEHPELKVVYRNAQRLLRLVDQLLLFKKAESETDKLNAIKISYPQLCNDVFACFTEQARLKNISYEFSYTAQKKWVWVDREKIEIALFNILSNAFKYTPNGGKISFSVTEKEQEIVTTISDSGKGISPAEGEKLFRRFYQVKETGSQTGFGIGLYLVKHFVEAHKGRISYRSEEGKGTIFNIFLPKQVSEVLFSEQGTDSSVADGVQYKEGEAGILIEEGVPETLIPERSTECLRSGLLTELQDPELSPAVIEKEVDCNIEKSFDKQTLLLIDDDHEIRNYLVSLFHTEYKIYGADCAERGVELAHEHLPDLIICDIVMKGATGLDLCRTLKNDKTVSHIPIILLTGTSSDEMQLKGMESGADDYITKPFDKDILAARVRSILNRRNVLQDYFFNEVTFGGGTFRVSTEYKEFLGECIRIIESHLLDENFTVKTLLTEIGMSHTTLYKKVKSVSGQSINGFIRFIRLRKAAEIFINSDHNVSETANMVGFYDVKYFRSQFCKLFGVNPSEYIKKYRKSFQKQYSR